MKIYNKIFALMILAFALASCEKNEVLPDYQLVGTSTATIANISVSEENEKVLPGEEILVTLYYVNRADDPATELELLAKTGDGEFNSLTTLDESSAGLDEEISRTFIYTIPDVELETVIFIDMVLSSQNKEFPQRERLTLEVTENEEETE